MKKFMVLALSVLSAACCTAALAACGPSPKGGTPQTEYLPPEVKIYNDDISYQIAYTSEEECPAGNIDDSKLYAMMDFEQGKDYFIVVDFTISSFLQFGAESFYNAFYVSTMYYDSASGELAPVMDFTVEEAATNKISYGTEYYGETITTSYTVPVEAEEEKSYRIVFEFTFEKEGLSGLAMSFYGDGQDPEEAPVVAEAFGYHATAGLDIEPEGGGGYWYKSARLRVMGMGAATDKDVVIPNSFWGMRVVSVAAGAFEDCASLTGIRLADGLDFVGEGAFGGCTAKIEWGDCSLETLDRMYYGYLGEEIPLGRSVKKITSAFSGTRAERFSVDPRNVNYTVGEKGELIGRIDSELAKVPTAATEFTVENYRDVTVGAFSDCGMLAKVDWNMNVTTNSGWFSGCQRLKSVHIGADVESLNPAFFSGSQIGEVTVEEANANFAAYSNMLCNKALTRIIGVPPAISGSVTIPDGVTALENYVFTNCTGITSVTIPEGVTSMTPGTFFGCSGIETVNYNAIKIVNTDYRTSFFDDCRVHTVRIGDKVQTIPARLFYGCSSLENVSLGRGLQSMRSWAFGECSKLKSIDIPENVRFIDSYVFENCSALATIKMGNGVYNIGEGAFNGTAFYKDQSNWKADGLYLGNYLIRRNETDGALENYTVRPGTVSVADNSLYGVKHVSLPEGLKGISDGAFGALEDVELPSTLVYIGHLAFWQNKLKELTIPASVKYIGSKAFKDNPLTSVTFVAQDGWQTSTYEDMTGAEAVSTDNPSTNARRITGDYYWARNWQG